MNKVPQMLEINKIKLKQLKKAKLCLRMYNFNILPDNKRF